MPPEGPVAAKGASLARASLLAAPRFAGAGGAALPRLRSGGGEKQRPWPGDDVPGRPDARMSVFLLLPRFRCL